MQAIKQFLADTPYADWHVDLASADASFRRYFRLSKGGETRMLMDSSLEKDSVVPFLDVNERLQDAGVASPRLYVDDVKNGFLILEDFGCVDLLRTLKAENEEHYYKLCIDEIVKMQKANEEGLPKYDKAFLHFEMDLMQEWFFEYIEHTPNEAQLKMLERSLNFISDEVLEQPYDLFVHRDYHSRNIMVQDEKHIGVIDFQDAMSGGVTYDLVSLLRDLYYRIEPSKMEELALYFKEQKGIDVDDTTFLRWFDFTGLQRHIKVLGIFARLYLRDGKDGYLKDLPLTLAYVLEVSAKYEELHELHSFLSKVELP